MKVKELIEALQKCNQEAVVVKSADWDYVSIGTVSENFLREIQYDEEHGVETVWTDAEESEEGAFPVVYLGI